MGEVIAAAIDGTHMDPAEATISVLDDGLLRGDGAFEAIKLYEGHPFRLGEHLQRLVNSASAIDLEFDLQALRAEVAALLSEHESEAMLRVVVTRGGRRILLVEKLPDWPPSVAVALLELTPSEILKGVKSISYAANMHATRLAAKAGAGEALYVRPDGVVLEAPTSSVFWVGDDGTLRTPALDTGILDSITRRVVVAGVDIEQGAFDCEQLRGAGEAFLASTTREIQPISAVDGVPLGEPDGGPAAELAASVLAEAVADERPGDAARVE